MKAGLGIEEANEFERVLKEAILSAGAKASDQREVWRELVSRRVLKPWHPHELHQLVYYSVYANWDLSTNGPPLYWFPSLYAFICYLFVFHFSLLFSSLYLLSFFSPYSSAYSFAVLSFLFVCLVTKRFSFLVVLPRLCEKQIDTHHLTGLIMHGFQLIHYQFL